MIAYETIAAADDRPWLTLVHGFSQNRHYFTPAIDRLERRYRLLLVDLRGHGDSAAVPGPFGIEEYADDLGEVFRREEIGQTHYWATHTGTAVGLVLALRGPRCLEKLVLEGAVLPGVMPRVAELQARASRIARSDGVEQAIDDWFEHADWFANMRAYPDETNAAGQRDLVSEFSGAPWLSDLEPRPVGDLRSRLGLIRQPTLLYNGEHDLPEFNQVAELFASELQDAEQREIAGAGGFPLWEKPHAVLELVMRFLESSDVH